MKTFKPSNVEVQATIMDGKPAILLSFTTPDGPKTLCKKYPTREVRDAKLPIADEIVFRIMGGELPAQDLVQEFIQ